MEPEFESDQEAIFRVDESSVTSAEKSNFAVHVAKCCRRANIILPTLIALLCLIAVVVIAVILGASFQAMLNENKASQEAKLSNLEMMITSFNVSANTSPLSGNFNVASLLERLTELEQRLDNAKNLGTTFVRWGSSACPNTTGTTLIYSGYTASSGYTNQGGGSNHVCLPINPETTLPTEAGSQASGSKLYGAEYESDIFGKRQNNVPCAVCFINGRDSTLMIPAKTTCPISWSPEYIGYLMSEGKNNFRSNFICVDAEQEVIPNTANHGVATDLYHVEAVCNNLPCPPYNPEDEINCIVCSR